MDSACIITRYYCRHYYPPTLITLRLMGLRLYGSLYIRFFPLGNRTPLFIRVYHSSGPGHLQEIRKGECVRAQLDTALLLSLPASLSINNKTYGLDGVLLSTTITTTSLPQPVPFINQKQQNTRPGRHILTKHIHYLRLYLFQPVSFISQKTTKHGLDGISLPGTFITYDFYDFVASFQHHLSILPRSRGF